MDKTLRETLGRVLYEEKARILHDHMFPWEKRNEAAQEMDRQCAEAVVAAYLLAQHRPIVQPTQEEIDKLVEAHMEWLRQQQGLEQE